METLTRVTDPYFGQYFFLHVMPDCPNWVVGPCAKQTLRTGYLRSGGGFVAVSAGRTKERIVYHRGVGGTITGVVPSYKWHVSPFGSDDWNQQTNIGGGFILNHHCSLSVSETRGSATLTARVERTCTYRGMPAPDWNKWAEVVLLFKKTEDALTHNVTYAFVKSLARRGNYLANAPEAVTTSCPYGSSPYTKGLSIPIARYWLDRTLELYSRDATKELSARDEAIFRALESISVTNVSWLENFSDATEPLDGIRRLYDAFSSGPWWIRAVRGMASLKLFWDYCVSAGISDAEEIARLVRFLHRGRRLDGLGAFGQLIGRGSATLSRSGDGWSEEQVWHAKTVLSPGWGPFSSLSELQLLGILPSASNIWDLVPFSFVVDWVLPVGKMLSRGDKLVATLSCPLLWIVVSRKSTITYNKPWVADDGHRINCTLTEVDYERNVIHHFPQSLGQLYLRNPARYSLNGLALLVQQVL